MRLDTHVLASFAALSDEDKGKSLSAYVPTPEVAARMAEVRDIVNRADAIRNKPFEEFDGRTLQFVLNRDRRAFNSRVPEKSQDPDESWKADTVRPVTRNKIISIAAHVTSSLLFPRVFAQNENDDEDKDAALVMRDLVDWAGEQSKYPRSFVRGVIKSLVDPAMIMYEGYADVMRTVKESRADGTWTRKEVRDEIFSGFLNLIVPCEELYPLNPYEGDVQKQPALVRQQFVDYGVAKAKYGDHQDFKYVLPGVRAFMPRNDGRFYQMRDEDLSDNLVEELTVYVRDADLELTLVNGILVCDPDRPMRRKDKKYPFAKTGYEPFGGTDFFWYKSLASKMSSDQKVIDALYNMVIDGTYMKVMPPSVVVGDEDIDSSIVIPGGVTTLAEGSTYSTVNTNNDLNAGMSTLAMVERSLAESSTDRLSQGMSGEGTPATAHEVSRLEANARTMLGLFGKEIASFVEDFGDLRVSTVLEHMAVAEAAEVTGQSTRLKFRQFLLPPDAEGSKPKKIEFDMMLPEDGAEAERKSFDLLEREHGSGQRIFAVNPDLFRRNKYLFKVKADFMPEQSEAVKKALNLEAYDRAIKNPYLDQEKVTAEFLLESYRPGESEKYMAKRKPAAPAEIDGGNSNVTSQILNRQAAGARV